MKPFRKLTRRGRLVRLKTLAQTALCRYHLENARLQFIQYGENAIFRVDGPGPSAAGDSFFQPNRYVLRIHGLDDVETISSELIWLEALNREAGLPVPVPVPTTEGKLLDKVTTPGIPQGRIVSLMRWLDGRKTQKGLTPKHLKSLGQVVAQLHNFSTVWQPPEDFSRFVWDWESQLGGYLFDQSREELVSSMPAQYQEPFKIVSEQAQQAMHSLGKEPDAFGLIHADLYPENVLYRKGMAFPIDFEDCGYGYWIWDIAVALCTWAWNSQWTRMRDAFFDGYSLYRSLPEQQWALLDMFVATQFATMVLWSSAFLKHDPIRAAEYEPWRDRNGVKLMEYFDR